MKAGIHFALAALLGLGGCSTPFRAPPDVAHIKLERVDSRVVAIDKIWLERKNGELAVKGYVQRQLGASDTTATHLDVTLFDAAGQTLRANVASFDPPRIPRLSKPVYEIARYRQVLDPLPPTTARIEVRAHEGIHRDRE